MRQVRHQKFQVSWRYSWWKLHQADDKLSEDADRFYYTALLIVRKDSAQRFCQSGDSKTRNIIFSAAIAFGHAKPQHNGLKPPINGLLPWYECRLAYCVCTSDTTEILCKMRAPKANRLTVAVTKPRVLSLNALWISWHLRIMMSFYVMFHDVWNVQTEGTYPHHSFSYALWDSASIFNMRTPPLIEVMTHQGKGSCCV